MRKIGIIFVIFGIFFPIILSFYTDFKGKGITFRNIKSGRVGRIVIKDAVYYTEEEYRTKVDEYEKELREDRRKMGPGSPPEELGNLLLKTLTKPSRIKESETAIHIRYADCLAFSILIFGLGLGFLFLGKKKTTGIR